MSYKPIDTSSVLLTDDIKELAEMLAKNARDIWAVQRMSDGWVFGSKRNDVFGQLVLIFSERILPGDYS
jgi:hypothetical protein